MRIFSNFDTQIKAIERKKAEDKFGPEDVLVFGRSKLYRVLKVFFPTFFLIIMTIGGLLFLYNRLDGDYFEYFLTAFLLFDIVRVVPIIGKYIDYNMDFIIVTPDHITMYDQEGILKKNVTVINEKSIKTIVVKKSGLLYSIFNNGDIVFLSEGDTNYGDITLRRVPKPDKRRNDIARIMSKDIEPVKE